MSGNYTAVDMLSLEDFKRTLDGRLQDVDAALSKLNRELRTPPAVGTFTEAKAVHDKYLAVHADFVDQATQLRKAIVVAQTATAKILANYRTTEEQNSANARDIASQLGGIDSALKETGSGYHA